MTLNRARTPEEEAKYQELLQEVYRRVAQRKFYRYKPYPWQQEYHNASSEHSERLLVAANRVGKTYSAAFEAAAHMTGDYPDWWEGRRFNSGTTGWACTLTNENLRDIVQKELLGNPIGTGIIPGERVIKTTWRQAGVSNVADTVTVKHRRGVSVCTFKTYEQGWRKFQGTAQDWIWLDEEPDDYNIFSECETRILSTKGIIFITFTPLLGETDLYLHFAEGNGFMLCVTWDDAPHLGEKEKEELASKYRSHEKEARMYGIPMMGEGRVFTAPPEQYSCDPFPIPPHWGRLCGIDFGWDHPGAAAWIAYDRDTDVIYVYDCYKKSGETAAYHGYAINQRGRKIPVSWPHDGLDTEKGSGKVLRDQYIEAGVNMLGLSARYEKDKGGAQPVEPIVQEVDERMNTGRLKVFSHLNDWFQESRNYHRKDGKIVAKNDDILKATFYAIMMKRYAMSEREMNYRPQSTYTRPILE